MSEQSKAEIEEVISIILRITQEESDSEVRFELLAAERNLRAAVE